MINVLDALESQFHSQGTLSYFTKADIIEEGGKRLIRKDFWTKK